MTPPTIERKNRERIITVSAVVAQGAALSDLVEQTRAELKRWIFRLKELAAGVLSEDQQDTFADLGIDGIDYHPVFIVMAAQFSSSR